jgi:hypothetical protein
MPHKPPQPLVQALVVCREIFENQRTGEYLLVGPTTGLQLPVFPAQCQFSVYAHLTGGHGTYDLELVMRDAEDNVVWSWPLPEPFQLLDPLSPHQIALQDIVLEFAAPGRFDLVLRANDEDLAHHALNVRELEPE